MVLHKHFIGQVVSKLQRRIRRTVHMHMLGELQQFRSDNNLLAAIAKAGIVFNVSLCICACQTKKWSWRHVYKWLQVF